MCYFFFLLPSFFFIELLENCSISTCCTRLILHYIQMPIMRTASRLEEQPEYSKYNFIHLYYWSSRTRKINNYTITAHYIILPLVFCQGDLPATWSLGIGFGTQEVRPTVPIGRRKEHTKQYGIDPSVAAIRNDGGYRPFRQMPGHYKVQEYLCWKQVRPRLDDWIMVWTHVHWHCASGCVLRKIERDLQWI